MAPALGLPDYYQPFHLHVHMREGFAIGILIQERVSMPSCVVLLVSTHPCRPLYAGLPKSSGRCCQYD